MTLRTLAALGALLTFGCVAALMLYAIDVQPARLIVTFAAVFGIALLAAAVARMGHDRGPGG